MENEARQKWKECLKLIKKQLNNDTAYATWFEPTEAVSLRGNKLTLRLQSGFVKEVYEGKYLPVISEAFLKVFGPKVGVIYMVPVVKDVKGGSVKLQGNNFEEKTREEKKTVLPSPTKKTGKAKSDASGLSSSPALPELNSDLSFDNFCVSTCNKLPWSIAESIARNPVNSSFNPFFLYGDVGVGKTHLMQAIGLHVKQAFPDKKVVFLPMKEFQRIYQNAYLNDKIPQFLNWFKQCDVLLFDDLQEITGSAGTLNNALFPIFSHLQMAGKQIVFTCDRPPQDLKELQDRLIDRFKWGIVEKLERPDKDLRKKILTFKAKKNGLQLPSEVIDFIASMPLNSVREIEGIVLSIFTRAINLGLEVDINLAREMVGRAIRSSRKRAINFDMIVEGVSELFRINSDVIFSKSRIKEVAEARMSIMYVANRVLGLSTGAIGRKLGRKHSTVIHGIKTISEKMDNDPDFAVMLSDFEKEL